MPYRTHRRRPTTRSTYDLRNRLRTVRFPDGRGNLDHAYAPDGMLSELAVDNGDAHVVTTTYAYNARRLLTRETVSHGEIQWPIDHAYDANGHLAAQSWDGLTVSYAPNGIGQPTRAGTFATDVRYHPNGAIQQFTSHLACLRVRKAGATRSETQCGNA